MGSRSSITKKTSELAYIAGFLDGDGSLMLQIKKRSDTKAGWRFMATICFYQDSRHEEPLHWFRQCLSIGYISRRNDNITELRINGYDQCEAILKKLLPYIKFKRAQAENLLKAIKLLKTKRLSQLSLAERRRLLFYIFQIQNNNYQSCRKRTKEQLQKILGLTP